jgi:hypothetical protein
MKQEFDAQISEPVDIVVTFFGWSMYIENKPIVVHLLDIVDGCSKVLEASAAGSAPNLQSSWVKI